jgi:hypothetical protein
MFVLFTCEIKDSAGRHKIGVVIHASDQQSGNKYEECHVRWSF